MDLVDPGSWVTGNVDGSCGSWILNFVFVFGSCGSWILEFRSRPSLMVGRYFVWETAMQTDRDPMGPEFTGPRPGSILHQYFLHSYTHACVPPRPRLEGQLFSEICGIFCKNTVRPAWNVEFSVGFRDSLSLLE